MKLDFDLIKEEGIFDYLSNHGHTLDKDDLINLFKEFNYEVHSIDKNIEKEAMEKALDTLREA